METAKPAQERQNIITEGHQIFAELKDKIFKELFDILFRKEDLSMSDYCRIGFSQGYLQGYRKAKKEFEEMKEIDRLNNLADDCYREWREEEAHAAFDEVKK